MDILLSMVVYKSWRVGILGFEKFEGFNPKSFKTIEKYPEFNCLSMTSWGLQLKLFFVLLTQGLITILTYVILSYL